MNNELISVIVPVYKVEKYLHKCVESIINQTYKNFEIILVDDGSPDNCPAICDEYAKKDSRIKVIHKENGGLSSARNAGVKQATGDYIWFVDGDDFISDGALEVLSRKISEDNYDVICFNYYTVRNEGLCLIRESVDVNDRFERPLIIVSACSKIYQAEFYKKNDFTFKEDIIYEDLALIPYIMCKANAIGFVEEGLYNYVYRENSIMNSKATFNIKRDDKFIAIETMQNLMKRDTLYDTYCTEIEYLTIKHLLVMYSREILIFNKDIYKPRCERVIKYLNELNNKWYENKYLKESRVATRVYVWLLRHKMYLPCKGICYVASKVLK